MIFLYTLTSKLFSTTFKYFRGPYLPVKICWHNINDSISQELTVSLHLILSMQIDEGSKRCFPSRAHFKNTNKYGMTMSSYKELPLATELPSVMFPPCLRPYARC